MGRERVGEVNFFSNRSLKDEQEAWSVRTPYLDKALKGGFNLISYPEFYCEATNSSISHKHKHAGIVAVPKIESLNEQFLDMAEGEQKELPNSLIYLCEGLICIYSHKFMKRRQMGEILLSDDPDFPLKGKYSVSNPEGSINAIAWWLLNTQLEIFDANYLALFPKAAEK